MLCLKLNRRANFKIHRVYKIKSDNEDGNGTKIALISLLIYNIICELYNVIVKPINKIVLAVFEIHPMPFLSHVHNMLYNVRIHENNLPGYYFIDLHSTSVHCHIGLFRKYVKVSIHRTGIYLENIHLLNNVFREKYEFQNKSKMYSFLILITYYYILNLDRITQNELDTFHYIPISNTIHSNIHILIIYILKMLEFFMYNIVLLYDQLYSHIIIYNNNVCTPYIGVHTCTCTFIQNSITVHLAWSTHYICIRVTF